MTKRRIDHKQDIAEIRKKAADHKLRPGSFCEKRWIDPLDYDRWEQSRINRKKKNHTLDPYR